MFKDVRELVNKHRAFYEVCPYYLVLEETLGTLSARTRTIQAGFDVDIYGVNTEKESVLPGSDYTLGYAEAQKFALEMLHQINDSCSLEVIPFPSRLVLVGRGADMGGMLRIRISHHRGLDQPAGVSEEQALKEVEKGLKELGLPRR
jgi:hypothetical protein